MTTTVPQPSPAPVRAGLQTKGVPVPLLGVSVEARLAGLCARVTISHRYANREAQPIEAVYVFPLEEGAAVCGFEAIVGDTHVVGEVAEKDAAFARYDDAMAAGHGAYLLDQETPDVFTASIGNVLPGQEVLVKVVYVTELDVDGDRLRFLLPTTVSPRYAPEPDRTGVGRTPAEALNPPRAFQVPYGLSLQVDVDMPSPLRSVESPSHPLSVELDGGRARVQLGTREAALDRDFVLLVRLGEPHSLHVQVERTPAGQSVAALQLAPSFETEDAPAELLFLVDRSGSMEGSSIEEARNALQLCLRSLTADCHFNIVGFGSKHQMLFPESRAYDDAALAAANAHVAELQADLGGTEILPALQAVLDAPAVSGRPRQVFVLTDGQVTNTEEVIALVARHADRARVFTFGIGAGASSHLVRGVARAGNGAAEFIARGERMEAKVLRQLGRAMAPALTDVRVDWGTLLVRQAPSKVPPVFAGGLLRIYAFVAQGEEASVTLRATGPRGPLAWPLSVDLTEAPEGRQLATLAARTLIRELEDGSGERRGSRQERGQKDRTKDEIVRLATTYGLLSRYTSFVAVEHRESPAQGEAQLRRIPVALTSGWGGEDGVASGPPAGIAFSRVMPSAPMMRASAAPAAYSPKASFDAAEEAEEEVGFSARPMSKSARPGMGAPARRRGAQAQRPLDALVALQRADGHWELGADLAAILGHPLADLKRPMKGVGGQAESAWATALAVAWLETHAAAEQDEWRLLAKKARAWLSKHAPARPDGRDWTEVARQAL